MTNSTNDSNFQQIGNYKIERHIASGGMAAVYLAIDESLQRQVALKVMLPALAKDADFVQRFQREARAAARLEHPNIVRIYETGLTPAQEPFIAMQYIEGDSLQEALSQLAQQGKVYPTLQALWLVKQVAQALDVAHQAGIVHRDLKPSNILLHKDGTPVLTDLGIATVQGETRLTQTGNIIGTPHYMSPEQVLGKMVDGRSDIYSLGIVLYELLAGRVPFDADSAIAILHQQAYETPPPLHSLRQGLTSQTQLVVNTCLQKEPGQRYATAAHLVAALEAAIAAEASDRHATPAAFALAATQLDAAPVAVSVKKEAKRSYLWFSLLFIPLLLFIFLFVLWQRSNSVIDAGDATVAAMAATIVSQTQEASQSMSAVEQREDSEIALAATITSQAQEANQYTATVENAEESGSVVQETGTSLTLTETAVPTPTPVLTATPIPTQTPLPTNTPIPTPTATSFPTATPAPTETPVLAVFSVEEFNYGGSGEMYGAYRVNTPGNDLSLSLAPSASGQAMVMNYDIKNDPPSDYVGVESDRAAMDWRNYSKVCMWVQNDGFQGHIVFQFREMAGDTWKTAVRLGNITTTTFCLPLNTTTFWNFSGNSNASMDLQAIDNFAFYLGDGGIDQGAFLIDSIRLNP